MELIDNGNRAQGLCPNCDHHSGFARDDIRQVWPTLETAAGPDEPSHWVEESVYRCLHCNKTSVFLAHCYRIPGREVGDLWEVRRLGVTRVHPPSRSRDMAKAAPAEARDLYLEGSRCEDAHAYRAAAGMYRGAVERICDDLGAQGRNLNDRINDLANHGVAAELVQDLHEARLVGNWSLHDGLEFSAEEVADVAELIAEAVHVLYVQPEERRRMREARKARRDAHKAAPAS